MNIVAGKKRSPLGDLYFRLDDLSRSKIRREVVSLFGVKEHHWYSWINHKPAYEIPGDVQQIFIREIPESAPLFERPKYTL